MNPSLLQKISLVGVVSGIIVVCVEADPLHPTWGSMAYMWDNPRFVFWVVAISFVGIFTLYALWKEW